MKKPKRLIGRSDRADFPELNLTNVPIKVDTGAYTSALHCHKIREETAADGSTRVVFRLLDPSHPQYAKKDFDTADYTRKNVRSSNGKSEQRYIIKTKVQLFAQTFAIQLSLSERGEMRFPVLIGRKFLKGRFIVDPSEADLSAKSLKASSSASAKTQPPTH